MKIILTESQYNKLLADSKKKVIITESQYNKLLTEIYMTENINEIKKNNSIVINKENDDKLFFKVVDSSGGNLLMVNTNKGSALTGSYFYIKSNGLNKGNLTYKFAYKKNVGTLTDIDAAEIENWKEATLKNIKYFSVFSDAKNKNLLFTIDVMTGKKETLYEPGEVKAGIKGSEAMQKSIVDKPNDFLGLLGKQNKGTLRSKEILDKWGQLDYSYGDDDETTADGATDNKTKAKTKNKVVEFKIDKTTKIIDQGEYDKFINVLKNKTTGKGNLKNYKPKVIDNTINGFYFKLILVNKIPNPNNKYETFKATVNTGKKGSLKVIAEVVVEINYNI